MYINKGDIDKTDAFKAHRLQFTVNITSEHIIGFLLQKLLVAK